MNKVLLKTKIVYKSYNYSSVNFRNIIPTVHLSLLTCNELIAGLKKMFKLKHLYNEVTEFIEDLNLTNCHNYGQRHSSYYRDHF